ELIAKASFDVYGTSVYPDATFTARLSYGQVKGWNKNGKYVKPITTMAGAFERNTDREPFALPKTWLAAKSKLNLSTPMNFCTDNDIIGGNSGSPVVNKQGEAAAAGGALHVVLGNHEAMNLMGDLRDTTPAELAAYAGDEPAGLRERLRREWLAEH